MLTVPIISCVEEIVASRGVNANGHFTPTDADVPLRMWLREHRPADAD